MDSDGPFPAYTNRIVYNGAFDRVCIYHKYGNILHYHPFFSLFERPVEAPPRYHCASWLGPMEILMVPALASRNVLMKSWSLQAQRRWKSAPGVSYAFSSRQSLEHSDQHCASKVEVKMLPKKMHTLTRWNKPSRAWPRRTSTIWFSPFRRQCANGQRLRNAFCSVKRFLNGPL